MDFKLCLNQTAHRPLRECASCGLLDLLRYGKMFTHIGLIKYAIEYEQIETVKWFLEVYGGDSRYIKKAVRTGNIQLIELILPYGEYTQESIEYAISEDMRDVVLHALSRGYKVHTNDIYTAICHDNVEILTILIGDNLSSLKYFILKYAILHNNCKICEYVLRNATDLSRHHVKGLEMLNAAADMVREYFEK
jgi:hypothetical protein